MPMKPARHADNPAPQVGILNDGFIGTLSDGEQVAAEPGGRTARSAA
jgi:hypothetical protein